MTSRDFCFWLQGFLELSLEGHGERLAISKQQAECIERHLALVFKYEVDPAMGPPEKQRALNEIHDAAFDKGGGRIPSSPLIRC